MIFYSIAIDLCIYHFCLNRIIHVFLNSTKFAFGNNCIFRRGCVDFLKLNSSVCRICLFCVCFDSLNLYTKKNQEDKELEKN